MVTAGASVDVQRDAARPHLLSPYGVTLRGNVTSVDPPLEESLDMPAPQLSALDGCINMGNSERHFL